MLRRIRFQVDAVGEADRLGRGEEHLRDHHLRRLDVVAADLIDAERDGLVLSRVLALDHQHRDAVDQEDDVLAVRACALWTKNSSVTS